MTGTDIRPVPAGAVTSWDHAGAPSSAQIPGEQVDDFVFELLRVNRSLRREKPVHERFDESD